MRRKLAAILVADVAGYSQAMGEDEPGTLTEFKRHLKEAIRPALRKHDGRLVKTLGDGVLAEFASAVNAVLCAVVSSAGIRETQQHSTGTAPASFPHGDQSW